MKVWQCVYCGVRHPGPSIDLYDVTCRCGIGKGRWQVSNVKPNIASGMGLSENIIVLPDKPKR